jgi:hypothetical protein
MTRRMAALSLVIVALAAGAAAFALTPPAGPRSLKHFDAARMADLELRMWQAYYAKQDARLFGLLVTTLHEQYRYSWATAALEGFHLARAAATFSNVNGNDEVVLPDLESAFRRARDWLHAGFDPRAVARAELGWWAARRAPGQNSPEQIGRLIAVEYALLYEAPVERVIDAAMLRAEAAALRDTTAATPDWAEIGRLLHVSYARLLVGLSSVNAD